MSLKPPKKSDIDKPWMPTRRDNPKKIKPAYHLIVTEGTKTEPAYFEAIRDRINRQHSNRIHLQVEGMGVGTLRLFDKAQKLVSKSPTKFSHVWVVYDTDDFPPEDVDETERLCKKYTDDDTAYHAVWSNQCIELWFLLHFIPLEADLVRGEYFPKLNARFRAEGAGNYEKNRKDIFERLFPHIETAIKNAEKLEKKNCGHPPSLSAPGTAIHLLVKQLLTYLRE